MTIVNNGYKEIDMTRYSDQLAVLPGLMIDTVDGEPVDSGFAVCEAHAYNPRGVELPVCFQMNARCYETIANLTNENGIVRDYVGKAGTGGYHADTQYRRILLSRSM